MRRLLLLLLIGLPIYFILRLSTLDKYCFLSPVVHNGDILIRCDSRGEGFFAANRSGRRLHNGIDLYAPLGSPVLAARSGRVIAAQQNNGMGKFVILQHAGGLTTLYGHLSEFYVRKGEWVYQGKVLAAVGKTGNANHPDIQPHLHFEVKREGILQDPLEYLE